MSFEQRGRPVSNDSRHGSSRVKPPIHANLSAKQKKHLLPPHPWQHGQNPVPPASHPGPEGPAHESSD